MMRRKVFPMILVLLAMIAGLVLASCGTGKEAAENTADGVKLPPGTTEEMANQTTGSSTLAVQPQEEEAKQSSSNASSGPGSSASLAGANFKVVAAKRPDSNADVIASGQREVKGDYLEIELAIENAGNDIIDLSDYSFRIWSQGIAADQYEDYYGYNTPFGTYVSENMISGLLLDYANLKPAAYKLKMGETAEDVFVFFDLSPKSVARNQGVTKEGTNLVVHKQRGHDAGEEVEINLAGYPD